MSAGVGGGRVVRTLFHDIFRMDFHSLSCKVDLLWGLEPSLYNFVDSVDAFCRILRILDIKKKHKLRYTPLNPGELLEKYPCFTGITVHIPAADWGEASGIMKQITTSLLCNKDAGGWDEFC